MHSLKTFKSLHRKYVLTEALEKSSMQVYSDNLIYFSRVIINLLLGLYQKHHQRHDMTEQAE